MVNEHSSLALRGFHLDMKAAQHRADYLREVFRRLSELRYTHVFFEIEDKVRLDTIRGAEWCEAFSKNEFEDILKAARACGLSPVPLIQTLGHLEFLVTHSPYQGWRELPNYPYMICPSNKEAVRHIVRYMDEVGELFGNPSLIHLGADEPYQLGACPDCARRAEATSKSAVFMEHLNTLTRHAISRGWRPIAWADHALKYPEALNQMNRDLIWMDWDYWTPEQHPDSLHYWKEGSKLSADRLPSGFLAQEGRFALDDHGRIRAWCYTDYLMEQGFEVIVAPSMCCGGDHVFAPRIEHLSNVTGACLRLQRDPKPMGILISSWAVRLNHVETQWPGFALPEVVRSPDLLGWHELRGEISQLVFHEECPSFFDAWRKIGASFVFAESHLSLEDSKTYYYGQTDTIPYLLEKWRENGWLTQATERLPELKAGYVEGMRMLRQLAGTIMPGNRCFRFWQTAAEAIHHKELTFELFIQAFAGKVDRKEAVNLLLAEEALRDEYRTLLLETYSPASVERQIAMVFGTSLRHLARLSQM